METNGLVFNIQKFSLHDGPGIRTTVFLKGCPLSCQWCANPESQLASVQMLWDQTKCLKCQQCFLACPHQAIEWVKQQPHFLSEKCRGCLSCVTACPAHALKAEGERISVLEVVETCLQDRDFYEESGGGVTISGGEGMMQPAFVMALAQRLKQEKIHLAIETTGAVSSETFQQLAPYFDLILYDFKHLDAQKHLEKTGMSNEQILSNLQWAIQQQYPILIRIPVIPDFNASLEDAQSITHYLHDSGIKQVQLLPFHQFGEKKYDRLQRAYHYSHIPALHPEDLEDYRQIFCAAGIDCFF